MYRMALTMDNKILDTMYIGLKKTIVNLKWQLIKFSVFSLPTRIVKIEPEQIRYVENIYAP